MKSLWVVMLSVALAGCMPVETAQIRTAAPPELLSFYTDADAYQTSASRRLCSDPSLRPRFEALQRRLAAAVATLQTRYGLAQVDASRVAVVTAEEGLCTDKAAAAVSLNSFESAVADLEAALS